MEKLFVFAYLPNEVVAVPAGVFNYDSKQKVGAFSYGARYIEKHAYAISPDLPISSSERFTREFEGLFGAFRDALPDYWGRTVFASINKRPIESIGEHELLLSGGASRIGNLDFRTSLQSPEPDLCLPGFSSLEGLIKAAEAIQAGMEVDPAYKRMLQQATSIGGMRPKCTIEDAKRLWIAKLPSPGDAYNVVRVETATMAMAKRAGITIPEISVQSIAGKDVFFIERFDRVFDNDKNGYTRNGFVSCLSMLGKHEMDRGFGYPDLADILRKSGDTQGAAELFKRMLFNIAIRNTDDHARNHGLIFNNNVIQLSPAFDITPTASIEGISTEFDLAINVGLQGRLATIENAMSVYQRFGITYDDALQSLSGVLLSLSQWREIFDDHGVSQDDIDRFAYTMDSAQDRLSMEGNRLIFS